MTPTTCDVLIIGGGMAGVSLAAELAGELHVEVVDMESSLAFHSTGRSAALYLQTYGGPAVRALSAAGRSDFQAMSPGMLEPMPALFFAGPGGGEAIRELRDDVITLVPDVELLGPAETVALAPVLRPESVELAMLEPGSMAIDVHALHQEYLRRLRAGGGSTHSGAGICAARRTGSAWTVDAADGRSWQAPVVVNAAGAWADPIGLLFGAATLGLEPRLRSAFIVDAPDNLPQLMIADADESFYFKPDAGMVLCSPAEETPVQARNAKPDELQIARAIEAINDATTMAIRSVRHSWAGLRTFAPDGDPVVGYDPQVPGLFWCAGQGGYGIQTAPAIARTAAALLRGLPVPADVAAAGVTAAALDPARPALASH